MAIAGELRENILQASPEQLMAVRRQFDPGVWAIETARIALPKGPFSFKGRDFIRPVYQDLSEEIVVIKGAQMGFSTMSIIRALWAVTSFPLSVIYTFPTKGDVTTFTAARINPIIQSSPYLTERIQTFDSVGMKQFARIPRDEQKRQAAMGNPINFSTIYFNGAQNPKDATSVDADLLIHDEEDRSDHRTIEEYQSRLYASRFKWMIRLSTPTIPGAGIDRQWKRSDMRHWLIRCQSCNYEFEMDFPQNIEPAHFTETPEGGKPNGTPARYKCHRCNATLTEDSRQHGRWVAERPQIAVHGYYINQMAASWVPAIKILEQEFKATHKGAFYNLVMARPFQEGTNAMTKDAILARQKEEVVGAGVPRPRQEDGARGLGCTMGIDVGKFLDVVIGTTENGRPRTLEFKRLSGETKWEELDQLMVQYGVVSAVIDADPEDHQSRMFCNKWMGRAWRCRWIQAKVRDIRWDEDTRLVTAPRTETLTRSSIELLTQRILPIYDNSEVYDAYIAHHENSKKVPVFRDIEGVDAGADSDTVDRERIVDHFVWRETGPDHMFLAGTYEMLARMGYQGNAGLPSVALVTMDRAKLYRANEARDRIEPTASNLPMLMGGAAVRRARRRH
jgi:hypothetical protein